MNNKTPKVMLTMLISLAILFSLIFGIKACNAHQSAKELAANSNPPVSVSAMKVRYQEWLPQIKAVGSLRAVLGVNVTTELAGLVSTIYFKPGAVVNQGDLLVELNTSSDVALLHSLEAIAELAAITYNRDKAQYAVQAVSKQTLDTDYGTLKSDLAQVEQQKAIVNKKIIRAPFAGVLGISQVYPGQYLNVGNSVVTLQSLDPIWVDFFLPQQNLSRLAVGQEVTLVSDAHPGHSYAGRVSTINPLVDTNTRNVVVEATIRNPQRELFPGMYVTVELTAGELQKYLTLPQTAVSFNPYGELVFILKQTSKNKQGKPVYSAFQQFVKTGDVRGTQIAILSGIKEGDLVVTAGQLKLKNNSLVVINNSIVPVDLPAPVVHQEK
jgi:membrane fusion protein (multidrug efflux system)